MSVRVVASWVVVACGLVGPSFGAEDPAQGSAPNLELTVMTFNVRYGTAPDGPNHWNQRKTMVFDLLREQGADIVGMQEGLRFQIDEIVEAVPMYRSVGVGRDDGRDGGEFSNILYRHDRFELRDAGTFWLSDTPEVPGSRSWGNRLPRICTWARLRDRASRTILDVYNTHLDHQSAPSRLRAVELIGRRIAQRPETEAYPVLVLGDFNAGEASEPMQFLRGERDGPTGTPALAPGLVDTFRQVHPEAREVGTFHGFRGRTDGEKIDGIFVRPDEFETLDAAIVRFARDGRYPSDHFPVTARVRRRAP